MCVRFVGCVDASGIIYDVQRQYVSQITIGPLLSAIKNTSSTFIRQINLEPMECGPTVLRRVSSSTVSSPPDALSSLILGRSRPEPKQMAGARRVNHLAGN